MDEEQIHLDAFEFYFKLRHEGKNKTDAVAGVSSEFNRSKSTIFEWKKHFNWDDKEAIRSSEINKEVQKQTNTTITDNKVRYLKLYHKLLDKLDKDFKIKIDNPRDLDLVIKGALLLQGEDTDRQGGLSEFAKAIREGLEK